MNIAINKMTSDKNRSSSIFKNEEDISENKNE
jgi:hypothetical protein